MKYVVWLAAFGMVLAGAVAGRAADNYWPAGAKVFFIEPKNGAEVSNPVKVVMGVSGIDIAPAGTDKVNSGHHHILIDTALPAGEELEHALPADDHVKHFGKGQTETSLTLSPGRHTLQLIVGDGNHVPHNPPLASEKITITVK
jgi:hypothetical protein